MPRRRHSNSPSLKIINKSVHPDERPQSESSSRATASDFIEKLFLVNIFKNKKKSFYIKVTTERVIHVQQYVHDSNYLLDETTLQPSVDNRDTAIVLFFIHGVGGSSDMWDPQIQYFLSEGYEIISLDLLGHGLSSKPSDYKAYAFREIANDVLHVFDIFCKRKNVLIGHSYGSSFCTLLSKERGNYISKMVLISGGGPTALMPERCSAFCLPLPMFAFMRPALVKMFRRMAFHSDTSERIRKKITTFRISAYALKAIMQGQMWPEADEEYHADLLVPVLLIYGRGDEFVSLDDELWMNETIYGSELEVIDNAGHMVMIEAPSMVNHMLHKFFNRDPSTRLGFVPDLDQTETQRAQSRQNVENNLIERLNSVEHNDVQLTDVDHIEEILGDEDFASMNNQDKQNNPSSESSTSIEKKPELSLEVEDEEKSMCVGECSDQLNLDEKHSNFNIALEKSIRFAPSQIRHHFEKSPEKYLTHTDSFPPLQSLSDAGMQNPPRSVSRISQISKRGSRISKTLY